MAIVYFDSSALVKLCVSERGSDLVDELWDRCDAACASLLAFSEVSAALAAARRAERLREHDRHRAVEHFRHLWQQVRVVHLTPAVSTTAADLTANHPLSGADAVHLASALHIGNDVVMATWDARLHQAALGEGFAVVPARIE